MHLFYYCFCLTITENLRKVKPEGCLTLVKAFIGAGSAIMEGKVCTIFLVKKKKKEKNRKVKKIK